MHELVVHARYSGGVDGSGITFIAQRELPFSAAAALGGQGVGTNPEELLACAAASCYLITFGAIATRRDVRIDQICLESSIATATDGGLRITRIAHRLTVQLPAGSKAKDHQSIHAIAEIAEKNCMIAAAVRGNVALDLAVSIR